MCCMKRLIPNHLKGALRRARENACTMTQTHTHTKKRKRGGGGLGGESEHKKLHVILPGHETNLFTESFYCHSQ